MRETDEALPPRSFEREVRQFVSGGLFFVLFLVGLSLVVLRNTTAWGVRENLERFRAETLRVAEQLVRSGDPATVLASSPRTADLLREAHARTAALYDAEGNRLAEASFLPDATLSPQRLDPELRPRANESFAHDLTAETPPAVAVEAAFAGGTRILRVVYDGTSLAEARRNVRVLSVVVPAAALVLAALVIPFLRLLMRPIDALTETARDAGSVVEETAAPPGGGARDEAERAVATFARTITELKRRTGELEELRRHEKERADALAVTSETLVRSHPGGLLVVDSGGRLAEANEPALEALDLPRSVLGTDALEALGDFPPLSQAIARAASGTPTLAEEFATGDATLGRRLAVTAAPVVDASGRPLGTLLFLQDRTRTSRLERELSARRELAALGEMSAGIAHEFRNATATILGWARLAATTEEASARARQLAALRSEAEHVARVTGDFLFFARPERLSLAPLEVGPVAEELVEEERMADPGTTFEIAGTFGAARADAALLRRALVNLLRNAREAASAGGRAGRVLLRGEGVSEGLLRLAVEDDGTGVPAEALPRLFVPFYSTKESGTGLGLALVAKIAALHGGSVAVERSAALGGARFVLSLPVRS